MRSIILAGALALSACETVRINGVEIQPEEQFTWSLFSVAVATALYHLADGGQPDAPQKQKCKRLTETGTCSIPFDVYEE
jgi:hypothetical protein